jgi:hypothetical protein
MCGLKRCVALIVLLAPLGSSSRAQGIVPGGWASQFAYQSLNGPSFRRVVDSPYPSLGVGFGGPASAYGGDFPYGYGSPAPLYSPPGALGGYPPSYGIYPLVGPPEIGVRPPLGTTNATGGLIRVIERTTRRSGR